MRQVRLREFFPRHDLTTVTKEELAIAVRLINLVNAWSGNLHEVKSLFGVRKSIQSEGKKNIE